LKLDYFTIKRKKINPKRTGKATRKLEIYMKPKFSYELESIIKRRKCWCADCKRFAHMGDCNE